MKALMLFLALTMSFTEFPPCPTEDSTMCYWDASTRSNGEGTSFIAFTDSISLHFK